MDKFIAMSLNITEYHEPNDIDVRIDVKYEIPSGKPFLGNWGRP